MDKDRRKTKGKQASMHGQTPKSDETDRKKSRKTAEWIGEQLREFYDSTASEPVPERFRDLLRQLDEKSGGKK